MADLDKRRSQNVKSNFFVDSTCIDCGTCYWMAPSVFKNNDGKSAVFSNPNSEEESLSSYRALYSCPTNSIGVEKKDELNKKALENIPYSIEDNVFHCGFHSEKSYGATSYFIKGENKNYLIDSPRFTSHLEKFFIMNNGIDYQLLTHKDDIADTDKYWEKFQGRRYIHVADSNEKTIHFEEHWKGSSPIQFDDEMLIIPVPGHTKGSVVFLYKERFLFTGDHLCFSHNLNHLYAFKSACWYNFNVQIKSMENLLDYDFEYVLPGHGAPIKLSKIDMKKSLTKCITWMKSIDF